MENRGGFNRGISKILGGADFKAAQSLYPEILTSLGVDPVDADRNARLVTRSIEHAGPKSEVRNRANALVGIVNNLTIPKP